jgi:hypothetical protein
MCASVESANNTFSGVAMQAGLLRGASASKIQVKNFNGTGPVNHSQFKIVVGGGNNTAWEMAELTVWDRRLSFQELKDLMRFYYEVYAIPSGHSWLDRWGAAPKPMAEAHFDDSILGVMYCAAAVSLPCVAPSGRLCTANVAAVDDKSVFGVYSQLWNIYHPYKDERCKALLSCSGCACESSKVASWLGDFNDGSGPNQYANDLVCVFNISFQDDFNCGDIVLTFNHFKTELNFDKVVVVGSEPVNVLSGSVQPSIEFRSTGRMQIIFTSDVSVGDDGWQATWRIVSKLSGASSSQLHRDFLGADVIYVDSLSAMGFVPSQSVFSNTTIRIGELQNVPVVNLNWTDNTIAVNQPLRPISINMPAYVHIDSRCQALEGHVVQIKFDSTPPNVKLVASTDHMSPMTRKASERLSAVWLQNSGATYILNHDMKARVNMTFQAFEAGKVPSFARTVVIGESDVCYGRCEAFEICKIADMLAPKHFYCSPALLYGNLVPLQKEVLKGNIDIDECLEGLDNCLAHEVCTDTQGSFTCTPPLSHSECREGMSRKTAPCTSMSLASELACTAGKWFVLGLTSSPEECMHEVFKRQTCRKRLFKWQEFGAGQCECESSPPWNPQPILYEDECKWENQSSMQTYRIDVPYTKIGPVLQPDCSLGPIFSALPETESPSDCMQQVLATLFCGHVAFKWDAAGGQCWCITSGNVQQCQYAESASISTWRIELDSCYDGHLSWFLSSLNKHSVLQSQGKHLLSRNQVPFC